LTTAAESHAIEDAFRDHYGWLVRRLALVLGDPVEAQDLAQQVFLRALEHRPDIDDRPIRPWLAAVGVNLAISERRRRRRWGFLPLRETHREWLMTVDPDLWRALSSLKPEVRAALLLTVVDGYTQAEVAAAFGVPRGTVASWLLRARTQLRPTLMVVDDGI
jgi:RNA polymerase sigma-70 factor (ECF subfamily)